MDVHLRSGFVIDGSELSWRFSRAGGPGGQGVNTTDSRVEVSWDVAATTALPDQLRDRARSALAHRLVGGLLVVTASEHRSQLRNREAAVARLAALVDDALRPPAAPRIPTRASRASRTRRVAAERHRRAVKELRRRPPQD